jgi:hypothetical protein
MIWLAEGLFRYGYASEALHIIKHRYSHFSREGYDTLGEFWSIIGLRSCGGWLPCGSRAIAHGGATSTVYSFASHVLGVCPVSPGCEEIEIAPQTGDLMWAKGAVPTAKGIVRVEWHITDGVFRLSCNLPQGMRGKVVFPFTAARPEAITVNGAQPTFAGDSRHSIYVSGEALVEFPCDASENKK